MASKSILWLVSFALVSSLGHQRPPLAWLSPYPARVAAKRHNMVSQAAWSPSRDHRQPRSRPAKLCRGSMECEHYCCAIFIQRARVLHNMGYCCSDQVKALENFIAWLAPQSSFASLPVSW